MALASWNKGASRVVFGHAERVTRRGRARPCRGRRPHRGARQRRHALVREADAVEVGSDRRDGQLVLVRTAALDGAPNEGLPNVAAIHAHIGRRLIVAVGHSAGDTEMLAFAHTGARPSLCVVGGRS
jgi:hypothetical protein